MNQCFTWWSFANRGVENEALLRGAREIGFTGVELMPPDLFEQAIEMGFEIVTHTGHADISSGLNDPRNLGNLLDQIESNLALAERFRIQKLIVFSGNRRAGLTDQEGLDHTVASLGRLAPLVEATDTRVVLELLNSKRDHPGYQCDFSEWGAQVIQAVNSPKIRLLYDVYHAQVMEGDLIRTIQKHGSCFGHYHTAGNPGRHGLDENQEINYPAVIRAIATTGYNDYIGHEFIPTANPLAALRHAYLLVESALCYTPTAL